MEPSCSDRSECDAKTTLPCRVAYIARPATAAPAIAPKIIAVIEIWSSEMLHGTKW